MLLQIYLFCSDNSLSLSLSPFSLLSPVGDHFLLAKASHPPPAILGKFLQLTTESLHSSWPASSLYKLPFPLSVCVSVCASLSVFSFQLWGKMMRVSLIVVLSLFILSFHTSIGLNSDGTTPLSLTRHWTSLPSPIKSSWNASDSTPCSWVGVQCHLKNHFVVAFNLSSLEISGQIGPEIGNLSHLKVIDFYPNNFSSIRKM